MARNILIVDDYNFNRKIIRDALVKNLSDISIFEADNGYKALELISDHNINVVILDIMMPEIDGIEVLRIIKSNSDLSDISVIMCSALDEIENIKKSLLLGALDYFTKPLTEEQIFITLPLKVENALKYYDQNNQMKVFNEHMKEEMALAEQLQKSFFQEHLKNELVEIWGKYIPCENIGGDIFCIKQVNDVIWFMIGDVSGHGISAAMVSMMLNISFKRGVELSSTPGELLSRLNEVSFEGFGGSRHGILSAFVGCIKDNLLFYSNAGHPYPILFNKREYSINSLELNGYLLGFLENASFSTEVLKFEKDDSLILFTDGLFDRGSENSFKNWSQVEDYCKISQENLDSDVNKFLDNLIWFFSSKGNTDFIDDVAVMVIKKL
jgi:phosphoserine phosphatase RsbU/P